MNKTYYYNIAFRNKPSVHTHRHLMMHVTAKMKIMDEIQVWGC